MAQEVDLKKLLKRAIELVMPDLRHYYRLPRKGRIVKSYASDGSYWADVQPLRNDESDDPNEPMIPRVEIPVLWGGPERGVICPPTVDTLCDITYYDGDPNYPRISNFRWARNNAPNCEPDAFIIQQRPGVFIKITPAGNVLNTTDADWIIEVGGAAMIRAAESATIQAPQINLVGNLSATGSGGGTGTESKSCHTTQTGNFTLTGNIQVTGNISASGTITDGGGNTNHHSH